MILTPLPLPWLEIAVVVALLGALCVSRLREPHHAWLWGLLFAGAVLACSLMAALGFYLCRAFNLDDSWSFQGKYLGVRFLSIDELSAPLVPLVALLTFLTALATGRTKMRRFSLTWSLAAEAIRLMLFACQEGWLLIALLSVCVVPAYVELRNRNKPTRLYVLHMALFIGLLNLGWAFSPARGGYTTWGTIALLAAILVRCGVVPFHCWITDWFEHASFGNALLFVAPLTGVYAALRLVLPVAPDWVLRSIGGFSLVTALYAACMAVVQHDTRRFFAYLFLAHASLVLIGLELHTPISLTGGLSLWISGALALTGFGLTLRALEARFGRLSLARFNGLYDHSPALAVCFMLTGLASVGFPGTLGFVAAELLMDGAVQANLFVGLVVTLVAAIAGIAVVRAFFALFTGTRHSSTVALGISPRERLAVLTLTVLILGGGLYPQPGIASRYRAASTILQQRDEAARNTGSSPDRTAEASN